jgi:hypothetical protein
MIDDHVSDIELTVTDEWAMAVRVYRLKLRSAAGHIWCSSISLHHELLENLSDEDHLVDSISLELANGNIEIAEKVKKILYTGAYAIEPPSSGGVMSSPEGIDDLPALQELVKNPITGRVKELKFVIMFLNDNAKWTREQIADWLESLDVDIEFKAKEVSNEQN